ncbi:MAG: glycosyltransferase family 4 protein [Scytonematopsis contorta HA4267-MV1]|jgi:glycosyltransferase involved in cell wall biosynthesis|nr:glycosyltransferase family 4 protein [Scytonematopsis contorta HA4267-MV1]
MSEKSPLWICSQLGAREHYAIPRVLHQQQILAHLITDAWISPQSLLGKLPTGVLAKLQGRFHPDLTKAPIHTFTNSLIAFEVSQRVQKTKGWENIIARNKWFQQQVVKTLDNISIQQDKSVVIFAYSYAALEIFRKAKKRGWKTILGQIDPGLIEEKLVLEEHKKHSNYNSTWQPAPVKYWENWQEECSLADRIVVNSYWSRQALQKVGIPIDKIDVIPLAYQPPKSSENFTRIYPPTFSKKRPLRVLFLGQIILRKGIAALLEAAKLLQDEAIEFWLVGSGDITINESGDLEKLKWIGSVPRSAVAEYYQQADVFLFPTLSDGFGLTQLEAQAWKLPIIASRFCGEVVKDKVNGLILEEVTGENIANTLRFFLNNPDKLALYSENSNVKLNFNLLKLHNSLLSLSDS